jgi:crossover junction endodeoxyribonuclease RuvC
MVVMGIDPGSAITGYGVVNREPDGAMRHVDCGCIRTNTAAPFDQRLKTIYNGVQHLIERHRPQQIAFEDIFLSRNVRSALQLGQARGAAIIAAVSVDIPIFFYAAREVKLAVTGYGAAGKEQVRSMVSGLLKIDLSSWPLDASDALAIAICHSHRTRMQYPECVDK